MISIYSVTIFFVSTVIFVVLSDGLFLPSRVQLHIHLDGAVRFSTISELAIAKNISITTHNTVAEIEQAVVLTKPSNLSYFLSRLQLFAPLLVGDAAAIERISYELVQDQAQQQVIYFEARFSPHLLANTLVHSRNGKAVPLGSPQALSPLEVIAAVGRGLARGQQSFSTISRMILCTIKGQKGWAMDVVQFATNFPGQVVGIDIAGNETTGYSPEETKAFQLAKELGIHRTVHSGEDGPASNVRYAVEQLYAERIGHGYHVLHDVNIYQMVRDRKIHFEACPWSSILTGSVNADSGPHPVVIFAQDGVDYSISTDDPTVTNTTLDQEYDLLAKRWGFYELYAARANINAARASFASKDLKDILIDYMYDTYWNPARTQNEKKLQLLLSHK